MKIERVYRPYLTAAEAEPPGGSGPNGIMWLTVQAASDESDRGPYLGHNRRNALNPNNSWTQTALSPRAIPFKA
jgi:hypothetical protein